MITIKYHIRKEIDFVIGIVYEKYRFETIHSRLSSISENIIENRTYYLVY